MSSATIHETDLAIGPRSIDAYSRLSYSMWYALAEFIDNTTQSRLNYNSIVDDVLQGEGKPLTVEIEHNRIKKEITIKDNSIGMNFEDLVAGLRIAHPTKDSVGRSKYGMGMKTAACWIGKKWKIVTCEYDSGLEWTAEIDVEGIAHHGKRIPLSSREVGKDEHYTHIVISELHRRIQGRTEETIIEYLGSMYRFDLRATRLKLLLNGIEITTPEEKEIDTDPNGKLMRMDLPAKVINGKQIKGWVAVLKKGGRKYGGFSLFQKERQIQGYPNAWKPKSIFGGVDDEGANNLVAQRLTGLIELDGFNVSHTKDSILFIDDEEEQLEEFLTEVTKDYRTYAINRRSKVNQTWSREKIRDLVESLSKEFTSDEMKDSVDNSVLPPLETIVRNNKEIVASVREEDKIATIDVSGDLRIIVSLQEKSEFEPHLTIAADAQPNTIHVIINRLHPYYNSLESNDSMDECIRQYIYDAIAEYKVSKLTGKVNPDSVRRLKDNFLRVPALRIENAAATIQQGAYEAIIKRDRE